MMNQSLTEADMTGDDKIDMFAAAAIQGMLAHSTRYKPREGAPANWHYAIAEEAYEIAHAMQRAREQYLAAKAKP